MCYNITNSDNIYYGGYAMAKKLVSLFLTLVLMLQILPAALALNLNRAISEGTDYTVELWNEDLITILADPDAYNPFEDSFKSNTDARELEKIIKERLIYEFENCPEAHALLPFARQKLGDSTVGIWDISPFIGGFYQSEPKTFVLCLASAGLASAGNGEKPDSEIIDYVMSVLVHEATHRILDPLETGDLLPEATASYIEDLVVDPFYRPGLEVFNSYSTLLDLLLGVFELYPGGVSAYFADLRTNGWGTVERKFDASQDALKLAEVVEIYDFIRNSYTLNAYEVEEYLNDVKFSDVCADFAAGEVSADEVRKYIADILEVVREEPPLFDITDGVLEDYYGTYDPDITEITIPESVAVIDRYAFDKAEYLEKITIPEGVVKISAGAFRDCASLKELVIPDSVTDLGSDCFKGCNALTDVTIGGGVKSVVGFKDCKALKNVTLKDGVKYILGYAFQNCEALESINVPNSVQKIGSLAFGGCTSLKSFVFPDEVVHVYHSVLKGCTSLESVVLPRGAVMIWAKAFENCVSLKNITIPDSVGLIEDAAFDGCDELTISASRNTEAERYAKDKGLNFIDINALTATPTMAKVTVNGKIIDFDAYTINGQTYYQIADIARAIRDTPKRFSAKMENGAIYITRGSEMPGEISQKGSGNKTPVPTKAKIYVDNAAAAITAFTIAGHTYYQMKDVAKTFNFGVGFVSGTITVDTSVDN
jgi:hypothetical protein